MMDKLTHVSGSGKAHMVNVSGKKSSTRWAVAAGEVAMTASTFSLLQKGNMKKGDVLTVAQIAGISAAKQTAGLIPLCHPIPIDQVEVELSLEEQIPGVEIIAKVTSTGKTGVEMEALTAVSVAALTIYDMVKAVEKTMVIQNIRLLEKHGGTSGDVINK